MVIDRDEFPQIVVDLFVTINVFDIIINLSSFGSRRTIMYS